jgi:hypothetical protein
MSYELLRSEPNKPSVWTDYDPAALPKIKKGMHTGSIPFIFWYTDVHALRTAVGVWKTPQP